MDVLLESNKKIEKKQKKENFCISEQILKPPLKGKWEWERKHSKSGIICILTAARQTTSSQSVKPKLLKYFYCFRVGEWPVFLLWYRIMWRKITKPHSAELSQQVCCRSHPDCTDRRNWIDQCPHLQISQELKSYQLKWCDYCCITTNCDCWIAEKHSTDTLCSQQSQK